MPIKINPNVIFLMGPTASEKTNFAIQLAQKFKVRLISVDSAMIYKGLDIGSAKPNKQTLRKYPHYLIDICHPNETYSAFDFIHDANVQIAAALANNELPILVGGTSFYFHALEHGLSNLPESNPASKAKFSQLLQKNGVRKLHQHLKKIDPNAAAKIHPNDAQRITRALEVFELANKSLSELQGNKKTTLHYPIKKIVLMPEREQLHKRIAERFALMLKAGLIDEVKALKNNPDLHADLPAMRCVGYRQIWQYLNFEINETQMLEKAIIATRQLCKRQTTWLKKEQNALVLKTPELAKAVALIKQK